MKLLLVDLSSLFRPIWEVSAKEPDRNFASRATVDRVRAMSSGFDGVAVCCDSPKSWRKDLASTYKANRPPSDASMLHQLRLAQETLAADGFPVWQVDGCEADDVIASAVRLALAPGGDGRADIVVASSDKDLMQLSCAGSTFSVSIKSLSTGKIYGPDEVREKFGVRPEQMRDWLVLVGDKSDNVTGVRGIGEKRAAELLGKHGSLYEIYQQLGDSHEVLGLTPAIYAALSESVEIVELGRKLVTLRADVQLPFDEILRPRVTRPLASIPEDGFDDDEQPQEEDVTDIINEQTGEITQDQRPVNDRPAVVTEIKQKPAKPHEQPSSTGQAELILRPPSWDLALEPTNASAAYKTAAHIFNSRLFSNMPNEDAVFAVILMGRTLGIDALTMLRNVHIIEGQVRLSAPLIVGLVLKSGKADYFKCVETTNDKAIYKTHRKGDPDPAPTVLEYNIDDAKRQQLLMPIEPGKKPGNWHKIPKTMLRHRCSTELARAVYPDVTAGLYSPDEFGVDVRVEESAA